MSAVQALVKLCESRQNRYGIILKPCQMTRLQIHSASHGASRSGPNAVRLQPAADCSGTTGGEPRSPAVEDFHRACEGDLVAVNLDVVRKLLRAGPSARRAEEQRD